MNVGVCKVTLRLPENESLKGKRRTMASLSARLRNKFNVSIAEVGDNESWQIASLGITCVSNDAAHADRVLSSVVEFIVRSRDDVEIVAQDQETIPGF
jgi:hypothetical protein